LEHSKLSSESELASDRQDGVGACVVLDIKGLAVGPC